MLGHLGQLEQNSGIFSALLSLNRNTSYKRAISLICEIDVGLREFLHFFLTPSLACKKSVMGGGKGALKRRLQSATAQLYFS